MTTGTLTLTDFLLARIAEDEERARAAKVGDGVWRHAGDDIVLASGDDYVGELADSHIANYIARHDPARMLAECEAKRRIIGTPETRGGVLYDYVLMCLALPYADHPDYQPDRA